MTTPYFDAPLPSSLAKLFDGKHKHTYVRHQVTCPDCSRTLVNVYSRGTTEGWKCLSCWQKAGYFVHIPRGRTK